MVLATLLLLHFRIHEKFGRKYLFLLDRNKDKAHFNFIYIFFCVISCVLKKKVLANKDAEIARLEQEVEAAMNRLGDDEKNKS